MISDPSTHKLDCLIRYRDCTPNQRLMKMQSMSNTRKTSFKRTDRKILVNVTLAAACNWFHWHVLGENSLERKAACPPCSQLDPVLKWNSAFNSLLAVLHEGHQREHNSRCLESRLRCMSTTVSSSCVLPNYNSSLIRGSGLFSLFIQLSEEISNKSAC